MADPPASAIQQSLRQTLEPDALSPLSRDECVSQLFVETAPSGSTEVSLQSTPRQLHLFDDSHNVVLRADEERDDTDNYPDNWTPPSDLSALRLVIRDTRKTPPIPMSRRNRTGSASSAASLNSAGNSNTKLMSPMMLLAQGTDATTPKNRNGGGGNGSTSVAASSSSSSAETGAQQAAQQPSTSRKVQRLSSMKKSRRGGGGGVGNTLLNRLFCNSPLALSNTHTHGDPPEQFPMHSGSSSEENNNPLVFQARVQELVQDLSMEHKPSRSKEDDGSVAGKLLKSAKEKLTLYDEAKVRESVQLNISETLQLACSAPSQDSPPSFHASSTEDSKGEKKAKKQVTLLTDDIAGGSTGTGSGQSSSSGNKKSKKLSILDDAGSIQEPKTKLSMFDDDDDIAETASQPTSKTPLQASTNPPLSEVLSKSKSREEKSKNRSNGKPMKTPGGLVIPSPFTFSAKSVFPAAFNACYPTTMPVEEEEEQIPELPRRKTPPRVWPPQKGSKDNGDKDDPPEAKRNRVEDYRDDNSASPIDMYRMASSLEDLETVPEASSSKETATKASRTVGSGDDGDEGGPIPNSLSSLTEYDRKSIRSTFRPNLAMTSRDEGPVTSPLTITSSTGSGEQAQQQEQQQQQQQQKSSAFRKSDSFRELTAKYERKFSEQKNQALVLGRLANQRLSEIQKLEGQMAEKKVGEDRKVRELHTQLERQRQEMDQELSRLSIEMEAKKEADHIRRKMDAKKKDEVERLRSKNDARKEGEVDGDTGEEEAYQQAAEKNDFSRSPSLKVPPGELQRVKRELSDVKALLQAKEKELEQRNLSKSPAKINTGTDALYRITKELAEVKEKLNRKEKEIQEKDDAFIGKKEIEAELELVKQQLESKKKTEEELERAKRELADVKAVLTASKETTSMMTVPSEIEAELQRVKIDFSELTKKLVEKEKELEISRNTSVGQPPPERQRSPIRPYPFPSPGRRRLHDTPPKETPPKDEKESLRKEIECLKEKAEKVRLEHEREIAELRVANELDLKRERDIFRKQKIALDDKAAKAMREHERSLSEIRTELEKQLDRKKRDTEKQVEQQLTASKQRELEGALAESCVREANEKANLEKQIEQLRAEKAAAQSKVKQAEDTAEQLLDQIATLEKKQTKMLEDHVRSMQDLRTQNLQNTEELREQMQKDAQEREMQLRDRLRAISEAHISEKESLTTKIVTLEIDLENERKGATLVDTKFGELEKIVEAEKKRHREVVEDLQTRSNVEIERLKEELEDRIALEEAMQIATNERDTMREEVLSLKNQINESTSIYLHNLEGLQKDLSDSKTSLEEAIERNSLLEADLKNQLSAAEKNAATRCEELHERLQLEVQDLMQQLSKAKEESVRQCKELCEKHQKEIKVLKEQHSNDEETFGARVAESKALLEEVKQECDNKIKNLESELIAKELSYKKMIDEAAKLAEAQEQEHRAEYTKLKKEHVLLERCMKEAEVNHNKQFEDLLSQLDLVVAEHRQSLSAKDKLLLEKEDMVAGLRKELEETHRKMAENEQRLISQMEDTEQEQHKSESLHQKIVDLNQEIESLRESQKKFAREALREKERACNIAREEMIEKAEAQFQQANDHYIKLRKQYDDVNNRAKKLEGELRIAKRKAEKLAHEKESCEVDLNAEIAKLKSSNAKIDADSAQKAKEYRRELERLLQTAKDFESKFEESENTVRHTQTMLATMVAEKEKLQREYEEMKSVSEELMAIVEGQNIGQAPTHDA